MLLSPAASPLYWVTEASAQGSPLLSGFWMSLITMLYLLFVKRFGTARADPRRFKGAIEINLSLRVGPTHSHFFFLFWAWALFIPVLTFIFLSFQRRCTTSQWASTCLTPHWFAARPGGQTPTSAGSMREWLSPTLWDTSPKMEQHCMWLRLHSVAISPAWSATSWATVLLPTQQVRVDSKLFLC